jgi:hypothetical protein
MNPIPLRPWWLRKRILFPLVLLVGIGITGLIAFVNSDASTIVIYNETDNPLPPLLVGACGQMRTFPALADQESVCFALKPDGAESAIHLELATDPPWKWDGELIRPHGGHRVTIRLLPDGQVEAFDQISWWRR